MTDNEKKQVKQMRAKGMGYGAIAKALDVSINSVKTYCRRNNLTVGAVDGNTAYCECCGKEIQNIPGKKKKRFCSDKCRNAWWNENIDQIDKKAQYELECAYCGKSFISYGNKGRKYCCHPCYVLDHHGDIKKEHYEKECKFCNKTFITYASQDSDFCSVSCRNAAKRGDKNV